VFILLTAVSPGGIAVGSLLSTLGLGVLLISSVATMMSHPVTVAAVLPNPDRTAIGITWTTSSPTREYVTFGFTRRRRRDDSEPPDDAATVAKYLVLRSAPKTDLVGLNNAAPWVGFGRKRPAAAPCR